MRWRRVIPWLVLAAALVALGATRPWRADRDTPLPSAQIGRGASVQGRVIRVVDGDTIKVAIGSRADTVRYIGMDTPESRGPVECFSREASAYNRRLVDGQRVLLRTDAEPRDRYRRLLAYVYRRSDGLFVNGALVRAGYATILTIPPNVAHADELRRLERQARRAGSGLWRACP